MVGSTPPCSISLAGGGRNPSMDPRLRHGTPQHPKKIREVYMRADLMTFKASHKPPGAVNSTPSSLSSGTTTTPTPSSLSSGIAATPTPSSRFPVRSSSMVTIVVGAVSGVVALTVILALIYVLRVRRRVRNMKRCTDVLGPELAPPVSRPPVRANGVTITLDSHVKVDDDPHVVSPVSPVHHGRLRSSSIPSVTSVNEQAFTPLSATRRPTITAAGISPAVSPLTPYQPRRSLSSSPSITLPSKESSLSSTRRHPSTIVIGNPPSLQKPEQHGRSPVLSTSPTNQGNSLSSSPTHRRRPNISVDIPPPPLTLHQYKRRSSLGAPLTENANSPQSPTRRRRRRRTISVGPPPAIPPPLTLDPRGRLPSRGAPLAEDVTASPTEVDSNSPSSSPGSTTSADPPPPASPRASVRSNSRARVLTPNATRPWHFPTSHPRYQPPYDMERSARSGSSPEA